MRKDDSRMGPSAKADLGDMRTVPKTSDLVPNFSKRFMTLWVCRFTW